MPESNNNGVDRRTFIKNSSKGMAAIAAMTSAPAVLAAGYSPNEVIRTGHVGTGVRGGQLVTNVAGEPDKGRPGIKNTQVHAICEIYKGHLDKGLKNSANQNCKAYHNYEDILSDKDIDAVVIATPDHWHSRILIDAANTGKDIYVEKCWTRTIPEAKAMLKAIKLNKTVMQLGHNRSSAAAMQASELILQGILGDVVLVQSGCFRNREWGKDEWRWYGWYNQYDRPDEEMTRSNLDWPRYLGDAPYHPFSMERFWHWRCYWDYGTGIAGDLLSHSFDYIQYILKMGIPYSANCSGAMHLLNDGRECPDFWNVVFDYPDRGMSIIDTTTFHSNQKSDNIPAIRGKDAMMAFNHGGFEVYAEEPSLKYKSQLGTGEITSDKPFKKFDPKETPKQPSHMEDFFNCMRNRQKPKDNEDEAFIEAVTCIMSVMSYFKKQTVYWDTDRQEIYT